MGAGLEKWLRSEGNLLQGQQEWSLDPSSHVIKSDVPARSPALRKGWGVGDSWSLLASRLAK